MIGKRRVLRTGFGIVIRLLVIATVTAYRIQDSFSKRTVAIHHRYVQQQTVLNNLRRALWSGGILARDFFLNEASDRASMYQTHLNSLRADADLSLRDLQALQPPEHTLR